jgi:hypothetical protein
VSAPDAPRGNVVLHFHGGGYLIGSAKGSLESGGQSQISTLLEPEPSSDRIKDAMKFAREHLHEPLAVDTSVPRLGAVDGGQPFRLLRQFHRFA